MPWYYAGPEAKPVGPISAEELQARRLQGVITPETYVIEHTGQPGENLAWKRYREIFPTSPSLPPIPALATPTPAPVPTIPTATPAPQPHPLFPSATPASTPQSVFPATARPDPYYQIKPTNSWCAWGFGLGLAGFFFSFACGLGLLLALPSLLLCIVGLAQVHKNREQSGQGLAIAGLILSGIALIIAFIFILAFAVPMIKAHGLTVTEQTSNDSE
jgi:hypothetical protein